MKKLTKEQQIEWEEWLFERPDNVKEVAKKIVPWKKYVFKETKNDIGNRYIPFYYEKHEDDSVTIICIKTNVNNLPTITGYKAVGINPDDLIETKD